MDSDKRIDFLIVIAPRKKKGDIVTLLTQSGARVINTIYGKGSVKASLIKDIFGFIPEENKIIATCLLSAEKSDAVIKALNEDHRFDKPNTGIAFTVPIEGLSY